MLDASLKARYAFDQARRHASGPSFPATKTGRATAQPAGAKSDPSTDQFDKSLISANLIFNQTAVRPHSRLVQVWRAFLLSSVYGIAFDFY